MTADHSSLPHAASVAGQTRDTRGLLIAMAAGVVAITLGEFVALLRMQASLSVFLLPFALLSSISSIVTVALATIGLYVLVYRPLLARAALTAARFLLAAAALAVVSALLAQLRPYTGANAAAPSFWPDLATACKLVIVPAIGFWIGSRPRRTKQAAGDPARAQSTEPKPANVPDAPTSAPVGRDVRPSARERVGLRRTCWIAALTGFSLTTAFVLWFLELSGMGNGKGGLLLAVIAPFVIAAATLAGPLLVLVVYGLVYVPLQDSGKLTLVRLVLLAPLAPIGLGVAASGLVRLTSTWVDTIFAITVFAAVPAPIAAIVLWLTARPRTVTNRDPRSD